MSNWKNYFYMLLGVLLPVLYNAILSNNPDFPIDLDTFIRVVLYVIAGIVGGWNIKILLKK